jgi:hypothetical protein
MSESTVDKEHETSVPAWNNGRLILVMRFALEILVLAVFVYAAITARTFPHLAAMSPFYTAVAGVLLTSVILLMDIRTAIRRQAVPISDLLDLTSALAEAPTRAEAMQLLRRSAVYFAAIVGFFLLIFLASFPVATVIFLTVFLIIDGRVRPVRAFVTGLAVAGVFVVIARLMELEFPPAFWQ